MMGKGEEGGGGGGGGGGDRIRLLVRSELFEFPV